MQSIKQVQRLNQAELDSAVAPSASWHTDYRDTAYIYVGGLPLDLSEGDVVTIFSQYGEPVWIRMMRDKETGKSRGFAWLKYEDQRSCDLAVDNLSGATVMGRLLAVDHARYQKKDNENEMEGYIGQDRQLNGEDGDGRKGRRSEGPSESESETESRPMIKEEIELAKLLRDHDDDDPMKAYMVQQKKEEIEEALKAVTKPQKREDKTKHRHHRSRREDDDHERRDHGRHRRRSKSVDDRDRSKRHDKRQERQVSPDKPRRRSRSPRPRHASRSRSPRRRR